MSEKTSQIEKDEYGYIKHESKSLTSERLDLNNLLKRMKEEKKSDKKSNILIFSGVASLAAILILILSF